MVAAVAITNSVIPLEVPDASLLEIGSLAVNVTDGALYTKDYDDVVRRIEGDTGNGTLQASSPLSLGSVMGAVVDIVDLESPTTASIAVIELREGQTRIVRFTSILTLTHSASLVLPGAVNKTTAVGDYATFRGYAGGVVRCRSYTDAAGVLAATVAVTNDTTTNATMYPTWVTANTGAMLVKVSGMKLTFNPSTGLFTAPAFAGQLNGAIGLIAPTTADFTSVVATTLRVNGRIGTNIAPLYQLHITGSAAGRLAEFYSSWANGVGIVLSNSGTEVCNLGSDKWATGGNLNDLYFGTATAGDLYLGYNFSKKVKVHTAGMDVTGAATVSGAFGCNTKAAQTVYSSGGALAAYAAGANGFDTGANASALHAMVVSIRAALVANGIMS